jgi:hypothetical protein
MLELQKLGNLPRFWQEFDLSNYDDVLLARAKVRHVRLRAEVDIRRMHLILPAAVVKQLGLRPLRRIKVRNANGRLVTRDVVGPAYVELCGRNGTFSAIAEPKREHALIGSIILESLDLLPDGTGQRLVPRDPKMMTTEIE